MDVIFLYSYAQCLLKNLLNFKDFVKSKPYLQISSYRVLEVSVSNTKPLHKDQTFSLKDSNFQALLKAITFLNKQS